MKKSKILVIFLLFNPIIISVFIFGTDFTTLSDNGDKISEIKTSEQPEPSQVTKDWTFMVYIDADCNLEQAGIDDINEMEMEGSDSNINVIVQIDRIPGFDDSEGDWTGAKRYHIIKDYDSDRIGSTAIQDLGEVNMGSVCLLYTSPSPRDRS